ncbi:MAG: 23S rRNA (pseudouridine(1915)-N(3))-methyltransferase RlmH [Rhizobiaceae bacterium]|nr:23S rRNA (pseudouridine(1915)-N(3))-methyltransferase RlmH [Rhizobiaceae bacterium]MCV0406039.1 23S rRNA (pseudouridine(1915)-N(3))-methyltransferase RlmH [Rhizobiaceae bacterium]
MKIGIVAVGRLKAGPERELADRYLDRFSKAGSSLGLSFRGVIELAESRARTAQERRRDEADRLRGAMAADATTILLDETGKALSSAQFSQRLQAMRDGGTRDLDILIGGPDGFDRALLDGANSISFGRMTWPHQIVRVMLAEQLYRAATMLSGHPYHRS